MKYDMRYDKIESYIMEIKMSVMQCNEMKMKRNLMWCDVM